MNWAILCDTRLPTPLSPDMERLPKLRIGLVHHHRTFFHRNPPWDTHGLQN